MRWKMPNVAVVAVATAAALFLVTAETVLDAGGGGNRGGVGVGGGGGGGGGGERQRDAATAAANGQEDSDSDDELEQTSAPQTPVQCGANCANHEEIKSLSIELIKASILKKLGMQQPPEFSDRSRPKVPTDLPPLQDLINKYNKEHDNPVVMPLRHMRHQSHHDASGDGGYDMQSDEATGYAAAIAAAAVQMENNNNSGDGGSGGGDDENEDDDEDDYHVRTHKLIAFAQPHPTVQKVRGHNLLYFTFSEQTGQHRITQAILWVYRKRVDIIVDDAVVIIDVHRINQMTMHQTFVATIKHVVNSTEATWVSIDLQKRMFKATDRAKNLTLMVHAYYSNKNTTHAKTPFVTDARKKDDMTKVPYLEVHTEYNRRSRSKRNVMGIDCDETSTESKCCRYPLTVDFEEFGWDWIIAPKRYTANYCSGECPLVFLQKYPHTYLAQLANQTTRVYPGTGPCCAPRKLSAISMLYFDQDYNIIYGLLPGMVADRCGCS